MKTGCIANDFIYKSVRALPCGESKAERIRPYEAFYLSSTVHAQHGIPISARSTGRPVLLLAGTSIPIADRIDLVKFFAESGLEVASISNRIGGPFDFCINPKKDRVDSLRHYLQYLVEVGQVDGVDIVAQSYSAFEVVRLLSEDPIKYKQVVKSVIFINPPGFNANTGVIRHCSRFVWHHVLKGYSSAIKLLLNKDSAAKEKKFVKREVTGISTWVCKTLRNPTRTMKEVFDIVSYVIKDTLIPLRTKYHYDINVFLQNGDQVLPFNITLRHVQDIFPSRNIKVVPGGHNDVFFQEWQRISLLDFITEIRSRESMQMNQEGEA